MSGGIDTGPRESLQSRVDRLVVLCREQEAALRSATEELLRCLEHEDEAKTAFEVAKARKMQELGVQRDKYPSADDRKAGVTLATLDERRAADRAENMRRSAEAALENAQRQLSSLGKAQESMVALINLRNKEITADLALSGQGR